MSLADDDQATARAPNGRTPRIRDVAALASVSTATVSRTLASPDAVRPELRDRVMRAVAALGYTPNAAARQLRAGRSRAVLVLTRKRWSAPFFSEVLRGIDAALAEAGHSLMLANFDVGDGREAAIAKTMVSGHIDGAIVLSGLLPDANGLGSLEGQVPIVSICAAVAGTPAVLSDEAASIRELAGHFVLLGHRSFVWAGGPPGNYNEEARRRTLAQFLAARDLPLRALPGDFGMDAGREAAERFLRLRSPRPTAVLACSDEIAIGFVARLQAAGVRVPAEVSVSGFDGIEFADFVAPVLTTVRQPRFELGRVGARRLLACLEAGSGTGGEAAPTVLTNTIRIGGSTGPAPAVHGG